LARAASRREPTVRPDEFAPIIGRWRGHYERKFAGQLARWA
jgi:hypothetical protein